MNIIGLLLTLFAGLFILIGSFLGVYSKNSKKVTDISICLAFGVIIGLIVFELGPDAFTILNEELELVRGICALVILVLMGIVILKILDAFVPNHEHEEHHDHEHLNDDCYNNHLCHLGLISSIAIVIHNVIEGAGLYLIAKGNTSTGILMCLGIGLHNIPMGLVITTSLINSNLKKKMIIILEAILVLSSFLGGLFMFSLTGINKLVEGILLGIMLGMLLYIAIFELAHQVYHIKDKILSRMCILLGISILVSSILISHFIGE